MAYKICSECGAKAGPRKAICDCGTAFPSKDGKENVKETPQSPQTRATVSSTSNSFLNLTKKESEKSIEAKPIEKTNTSNSKSTISIEPKSTNKRNCLLCNTEYESEDSITDEYNKTHYYYKYARYCSLNCLENSDQTKTDIIITMFEVLNSINDKNTKTNMLNILNKDIKFANVLTGIRLDVEDAKKHQKYVNERPRINILSSQKKKLSSAKDFKEEGIEMPLLKDRKIEEPVITKTKRVGFLSMVDED